MDAPPIGAKGLLISKGRCRDMSFYKTVSPFERDHIVEAAFLKKAEIIVTGKAFVCYDGAVVRIGGGFLQDIENAETSRVFPRYCL